LGGWGRRRGGRGRREKTEERGEKREMGGIIRDVKELTVYKKAFQVAMEIFEITKTFPKEEKYSLTDQIRRSSRSVCANLSEAWRKRKYKAAFINKLSDSEQEAAETQTWIDFSLACKYLDGKTHENLCNEYNGILAMLYSMSEKADTFCIRK
jgi:four helix bundle protein